MNRNPDKKHEPIGLSVRPIMLITTGLIAMLAAVLLVCWFAVHWLDRRTPRTASPTPVGYPAPTTATPSVQPHQASQMRRLRRQHQEHLSRYEWVERDRRVARIPIDRALELMAESDWQIDWPAAPPTSLKEPAKDANERADEADERAAQATALEVEQ